MPGLCDERGMCAGERHEEGGMLSIVLLVILVLLLIGALPDGQIH
jgi:hypothetical protein